MLAYLTEGLDESYSISHDERAIDMITGITDYIIREPYISPCCGVIYESPIDIDVLKNVRNDVLNSLCTHCDCTEFPWGSEQWKECTSIAEWRMLSPLALSYKFTGKSYYKNIFDALYKGCIKKKVIFHTWNEYMEYLSTNPELNTTPPSTVTDLSAESVGEGTVNLSWTVPARAAHYQVKFSDKPMKENITWPEEKDTYSNWWAAENVEHEPKPGEAGSTETMTISGIEPGIKYFAIRSYDSESNISQLSNIASLKMAIKKRHIMRPSR